MLTSTVTTPPAIAWPGLQRRHERDDARRSARPRARGRRSRRARPARASSAAGHRITGAAKYQTANVTGSHASTASTKRASGERPANCFTRPRARSPAAATGPASPRHGRQRAHPDQPDDQHVEHDQRLPHVQVRPLEHVAVPLPEVEQADHAHDVEPLHRDDAGREADELVLPRRGEREHRGDEHDRRLDAVAAGLDRHREAVASCDASPCRSPCTLRVEQRDERRRDLRQRASSTARRTSAAPTASARGRTAAPAAGGRGRRSGSRGNLSRGAAGAVGPASASRTAASGSLTHSAAHALPAPAADCARSSARTPSAIDSANRCW